MQFQQPDTLIPEPYNPLDWNRYSYVRYNPVNFNDPSGNKPCDGKNAGADECDQVTNNDLTGLLKWSYGWTTRGTFKNRELEMILDSGEKIGNYITTNLGKWGQGWVQSHLGNAVFNQGGVVNSVADKIGAAAFVFPFHEVNLREGYYNTSIIVHELGHVLDNNNQSNTSGLIPATIVGGGPADAMVEAMGGVPNSCYPRLQCGYDPKNPGDHQWYVDKVAGRSPWSSKAYGSNGVSDDFAETFRGTVLDPSTVPSGRYLWMRAYLSLLP